LLVSGSQFFGELSELLIASTRARDSNVSIGRQKEE
jgi:hypothetical protein